MGIESNYILSVEPDEINRRIAKGDTFVVNIVTAWCSDCTEKQKPHIGSFAQKMKSHDIDVLQVNVQLTKRDFISPSHEKITTLFGGPGYPRTVLIHNGNLADHNNVEIITEKALSELTGKFIEMLDE